MRSGAGNRYPPLAAIGVALFLAIAVLPSALNVAQPDASTTLEYAPLPPSQSDVAPPGGNLSSLGLATSGALGSALGDAPAAATTAAGVGTNPATKRCVGNPPRQTSDPLSPPCVAHFTGDNGGSTHSGVSRDEIRVLIFNDQASCFGCSRGEEISDTNSYVDLGQPPEEDEYVETRGLRVWQRYFNERFQTYNRAVRFFVYYGYSRGSTTATTRRAQAADNFAKIRPFAVVPDERGVQFGYMKEYVSAMASRGVLVFESQLFEPGANLSAYAPLVWGYRPSLEQQAANFASYVCTKVAPYRVSFSGDPASIGEPRRYGLVYTTDPATNFAQFKDRVAESIASCGVTFVAEATFPRAGSSTNASGSNYAAPQMADFQQRGVTTVIQMGGVESNFSRAAGAIGYRPEWLVAGDGFVEGGFQAQTQDQTVWANAIVVTPTSREYEQSTYPECTDAYSEVNPNWSFSNADIQVACQSYAALRQLFTGIQVAGPRLTPGSVEKGFRAIPPHPASNPNVPACFYEPGDFTCTKDATVVWWDPTATQADNHGNTYSPKGCWRMVEGGRRYLTGSWPSGDVIARRTRADPCNGHQWSGALDEFPG